MLLGHVLSQAFMILEMHGMRIAHVATGVGLLAVRNQHLVVEEVATFGIVAQMAKECLIIELFTIIKRLLIQQIESHKHIQMVGHVNKQMSLLKTP